MFTGKRFCLKAPTLAVDHSGSKPLAVAVPKNTVIEVIAGPSETDPMIRVRWEKRMLTMFALDIQERGEEVKNKSI